MLTGRNVLAATMIVAILSLLSITLPQNSESSFILGRNTLGVRHQGQRGLFETLEALSLPVQRSTEPPGKLLDHRSTIVFLEPDQGMIQIEPAYLMNVSRWVQAGGHVVYAPAKDLSIHSRLQERQPNDEPPPTFMSLFGAGNESRNHWQVVSSDGNDSDEVVRRSDSNTDQTITQQMRSVVTFTSTERAMVPVRCEGEWAPLGESITRVSLPKTSFLLYNKIPDAVGDPDARIVVPTADDQAVTLAAMYRLGLGSLTLLSDPTLAQNGFLSHGDNSVLLFHLLSQRGGPIVFDEFYHGLTPRGNPLVLLRRPLFSVLMAAICLLIAAYACRHSVRLGPAIDTKVIQRRSLHEYIEAVSRLFSKSDGHVSFLLKECRRGLVWTLQTELAMTGTKDVEQNILRILSRRQPQRAVRVQDCLLEIDRLLQQQHVTAREAIHTIRKVPDCL